jgi:hypothetical protein
MSMFFEVTTGPVHGRFLECSWKVSRNGLGKFDAWMVQSAHVYNIGDCSGFSFSILIVLETWHSELAKLQ